MKKFLMCCLSVICFSVATVSFAKEEQLDKIVVIVNDSVITQSELDDKIEQTKKQITASNSSMPPQEILRKQILDQMIDRKILLGMADQAGVKVPDDKVDQAIKRIAESNHMTVDQMYQQIKQANLSVPNYRKEIHDQMVIQTLQEHEVGSKIKITPQEVDDFMRSKLFLASNNKEYHIEDILIALPEAPTSQQVEEAKLHANAVLTKLHNGTSFSDVAMAESSGNKALQGGDLGWRKLAETPSAFGDHIINMQVNEIAGPIQTPNGFHLIRLSGIRNATDTQKLTKKQVEDLIFQRKMEEGMQAWLTKIRSEAFVNRNPEGNT